MMRSTRLWLITRPTTTQLNSGPGTAIRAMVFGVDLSDLGRQLLDHRRLPGSGVPGGARHASGRGPASCGVVDPTAQRLVVHAQLAGDLPQRTIRRANQLHGVLANCSGYFDVPDTRTSFPRPLPGFGVSDLKGNFQPGSERGSPNDGSTLVSKRVMAEIRSPPR
jgi:hypothetical protein